MAFVSSGSVDMYSEPLSRCSCGGARPARCEQAVISGEATPLSPLCRRGPGRCLAPSADVPFPRNGCTLIPGRDRSQESHALVLDVSQRASETTSSCTLSREQFTSAQPLDQRQLYLRLAAQRGGEADLRGVVSSYSVGGSTSHLTPSETA